MSIDQGFICLNLLIHVSLFLSKVWLINLKAFLLIQYDLPQDFLIFFEEFYNAAREQKMYHDKNLICLILLAQVLPNNKYGDLVSS